MNKKNTISIVIVIVAIFIAFLIVVLSAIGLNNYYFIVKQTKTTFIPTLQEIMAIIKKSPDYPEFLKTIKSDNFEARLVNYYLFSPEIYNQKMKEWEETSDEMKNFKEAFDTVKLNNNSYLVELESKSDKNYGLMAIIDTAKAEPQIIIAIIKMAVSAGF